MQQKLQLPELLRIAVKGGASDIHIKAGLPPMFRIDGSMRPLKEAARLHPEEISKALTELMSASQRERFQEFNEIDMGYGVPGVGRFRLNAFMQRGSVSLVFRVIPMKISKMADLDLPKVIEKISMERRGLVLVTGATGSGKTTTLASMIDYVNANRTGHILTIEDPIEYLIRDKKCIVSQREIGVDALSFASALRGALRQDPDVILVGEMRDLETVETALSAAETGHLVLSTLHTLDAKETISRVVSVFPPYQHKHVRLQLASVLRGVVSQRLVPRANGKGRVPACEVLVSNSRIRELIEKEDRTKEITQAIAQGHTTYGTQTFDQSLFSLFNQKLITYEEALKQSTNPDDFALKVKGISATSDTSWDNFESHSEPEAEVEEPKQETKKASETEMPIERF